MKKIHLSTYAFIALLSISSLHGALAEIEKVGKKLLPGASSEQKKIFASDVETKQEQLAQFVSEKNRLEQEAREFQIARQTDLEEIRNQINETQAMLRRDSDNELLKRKLALLNEEYHLLKERQQLWEQMIVSLDQITKQINDYLADPDFTSYKKQLLDAKKITSFDDLQSLHQMVHELDKRIDSLIEQEKNSITELDNRKRSAAATSDMYEKKKKEQETALKNAAQGIITIERADNLWDLQEKIFIDKTFVDDLKLKEIAHKIELIKLKLFVSRAQRNVLRDIFKEMKSSVQVGEADVAFVKDEFEKKKQKAAGDIRYLDAEIERTDQELKIQRQELDTISKRYNITLDSDLDMWKKEPKQALSSYVGICEVGAVNDRVLYLARRKDYLKSQVDLVNEKIRHEEILIKIKESFHKIRYAKFSAQELNQELKSFDMLKANIKANLSFYNDRKTNAAELLEVQKKAAEHITQFRSELISTKDTLFRDNQKEYNNCILVLLNDAQAKIKAQIDLITNIINVYADISSLLVSSNKQIDFIVSELSSITIWYRPRYAVSWEGLTSIVPDIQHYVTDLSVYLSHFDFGTIFSRVKGMAKQPLNTLMLFLKFILLLGIVFGIRQGLPIALHRTQLTAQLHPWLHAVLMFFVALGRFILLHFTGIAVWVVIRLCFYLQIFTDPYLFSIFYLLSIAFLLYLANKAINYFSEFNREHNYIFISREFEFRFTIVISGLIYATILLYFFKKAFMLGNYTRSELPTILVAINFIILQIALISLIAKEQILSLIPRMGFGELIYRWVERYYYAILIGIISVIILSNPYVGFGRLVIYTVWRILLTIGLVFFLVWLHGLIKRFCSFLFFITDEDEVSHERFANARTWYGFTVIVLFVFFIFFGVILIAKLWGWPEQLARISHVYDILDWLKRPFSHVDQTPVSVWVFLKLLAYILGGLAISFVVNEFVMGKIFDILLIDSGVQNTVASITYYLFFAISVIIGFNAVNLTSLLYWLFALVVGIGWIIKDPVSDFVAYFIILMQRPIKVGDLVKLDELEAPGIVRHITPRSVILRRKNSTTIIIPNSAVINKSIVNWNYARDFIAFEDIIVTIAYKSDPVLTQKILLEILAESSYVLKTPRPLVRLDNFSENGYVFMVRGYLSSNFAIDQWEIASGIRLEIVQRLKAAGIEIAVPVRRLLSRDEKQL